MFLLIMFLLGAMSISFLCSILESVLLSTPMSFVTMKEDEGYKAATLFKKYKSDNSRAIASILSLNTIAHTIGAAGVGQQSSIVFGSEWFGVVSAVTTILILIFYRDYSQDTWHRELAQSDGLHGSNHTYTHRLALSRSSCIAVAHTFYFAQERRRGGCKSRRGGCHG